VAIVMGDLENLRQQFPALRNKLYFNYGGQGPLPQVALEAIVEGYHLLQRDGPFSRKSLQQITAQIEQTHQVIAQELGATPDSITLTESVSVGCNIVLWGLPWQPDDHLLITDCEHPGIMAAVGEISRRLGVTVATCPIFETLNDGDPVTVIAERILPNTRLVVLSHILWNTGQVLPLAEIIQACRHQNPDVLILVDAAQSVGVLPLDLAALDIDFYAFTGHKWLCGPDGVGGLYVRPALRDQLQPTFIGWRGIRTNPKGMPLGWQSDGSKFEIATSAFPLYCGLSAALPLHHQWGTSAKRYQRICQLSQYLWQGLQNIPVVQCLKSSPPASGLVAFQVQQHSHSELVQKLEAQQIMMRLIPDPNSIRACVHYLTLESEIEQGLDILINSL
jgi:L-cysteine/cystine lyase